jgi:predicted Zn finger-like uncharacterized protein
MSTVRLRRLQADFERLQDYTRRHPRVKLIAAHGEPPERYQLQYQLKSLRNVANDIVFVREHMVEIVLPLTYPRLPPQCRMLTPIFHPNIAPHAICIGDHWSAGEPLHSIVARIGEMIAYQAYNLKSPLNGEAARWVDDHVEELPLDPVSLLVEERGALTQTQREKDNGRPGEGETTRKTEARPPGSVSPPLSVSLSSGPVRSPSAAEAASLAPPDEEAKVTFACPACHATLRVARSHAGKRVRCPKCQALMMVPGGQGS